MKKIYETANKNRRAYLLGIRDNSMSVEEAESLTRELSSLVSTLGIEIAAAEIIKIRERHPRYGMGSGKALEIAEKTKELTPDCLIFDQELGASQQRNWESLCSIPVVDRQEIIIQIFSARAVTREAELQVELAKLTYSLPRLSHKYIDLSQQRGGHYGAKGTGETRLETDRRLLEQRIHRLEKELEELRKQREVRRKKRDKATIPSCALVGYTNAGKSFLLNALTGAEVLVEDKLFATLESTTRLLSRKGDPVLLIDTVGFIRRLPHNLVKAFRSTLEETARADILVHVLDATDSDVDRHYKTTQAVLRELGAAESPEILVLNKVDKINAETQESLALRYPGALFVSAQTGQGLNGLVNRIDELAAESRVVR